MSEALPTRRPETRAFGHAFVLSALAVATPMCELLRRFPEFLWLHGLTYSGIAALVVILLVVPPLALIAILAAARGSRPLAGLLTGLAVALPVVLLSLQVVVARGLGGMLSLGLALTIGVAGAMAYLRWSRLRSFVTLLAVVALVAPVRLLLEPRIRTAPTLAEESLELGSTGATTPMVWVIFDELPMLSLLAEAEVLDAENFPNFARLARTSHTFLDARAVSGSTLKAVPALVSSRLPEREAWSWQEFPHNLFTLLGNDYEIRASEAITRLCPDSLNLLVSARTETEAGSDTSAPSGSPGARGVLGRDLWILFRVLSTPRPWADELPAVDGSWRGFGQVEIRELGPPDDPETRAAAKGELMRHMWASSPARERDFFEILDSIDPSSGPTLHFIHSMLPHAPWVYLPNGKVYAEGPRAAIGGLGSSVWTDDREIVALGYQRHLLQTQFADRLVGELIDRLVETGRFDRTLLVITADHGLSLRPGEPTRKSNPDETLWVPLFIKAPGQQEPSLHRNRVTSLDVLPTVLALLDVESPWPMEGASAVESESHKAPELPKAAAARRWKDEIFGTPPDLRPPLRVNRHAELIGRGVNELAQAASEDVRLEHVPGETVSYDAASKRSPTWVSGTMVDRAGRADCCDLAFAVNGRIVAVQHTFPPGSVNNLFRFQALLPETAFEAGDNHLRVYVVDAETQPPTLLVPAPKR